MPEAAAFMPCLLDLLVASFSVMLDFISCCFIHRGPKFEKSPANIASKRPRPMIDLDTKLKVIKGYRSGKSAMAIAWQAWRTISY